MNNNNKMFFLDSIPYKLGTSFEEINIDLTLRKKFSDRHSMYISYRYSEVYLFGNVFESICYLFFSNNILVTMDYRFDNKYYELFKESINEYLPKDKKLSQDPFLERPQLYSYYENTAISLVELNEDFFLLRLSDNPSLPRIKTTQTKNESCVMKQDLKNKIERIISNNPNADDKEIMFQMKQLLYETELQNIVIKESKSISNLVSDTLNQIKNNTQNHNTIKSGFADFDKTFGGFELGEFVVIGGRPGMGKMQFLINLSLNISQNIPVLFFSFDLSEQLLINRFISSISGILVNKISEHKLTDEEKSKVLSVENELSKYKMFVNDSYNNPLSAFKAHCQKQIEENGIKVICVDYLQIMNSNRFRNNRELEISYISRELKNIAKDFNVCVIATSQLSRAVETRGFSKRPFLSDLRESGAIEQDADKVIFIYRPEYYKIDIDEDGDDTAGLVEIILAKNKKGSLGSVKLLRDNYFTHFKSFDQQKKDFSFSQNRLDELDLEDVPF